MATRTTFKTIKPKPIYRTLEALFERFGPIPPARIRLWPPLGTAKEHDVLEIEAKEDRLCELIDGVLIEKVMETFKSFLAVEIAYFFMKFLASQDLGIILGAGGMLRLAPGLIRIPDVSFISWAQLPDQLFPDEPIATMFPDLAVEVISPANTTAEMQLKLHDYFNAGTRLVWFIYPKTKSAEVFSSPKKCKKLCEVDTLQGGTVLPGFELPLRKLFALGKKRRPHQSARKIEQPRKLHDPGIDLLNARD